MPRVALEIVEGRRRRIAKLVQSSGYLPVEDLCKSLDVSEATCRRDLAILEDQKQIRRTFGGALGLRQSPSIGQYDAGFASFNARRRLANASKLVLARQAVQLVKPRQVLFLDAGTTIFRVMEALVQKRPFPLTVVTHSLMVALHLGAVDGVTVHLLGGQVLNRQGLTLGKTTEIAARAFYYDLALLGAEAFNAEGIFNSQQDVVQLQKTVVEGSRRVRFLMDRTKAGQIASVRIFGWDAWPDGDVRLLSDASAAVLKVQGVENRFVIRG